MTEESPQRADLDLIKRVAEGDQSAFAMLFDRLASPLYSLAYKMLGDTSEAQDAIQDVFVQIWRRASNYDSNQSSVFTWAILLTRGRVIDRLRGRARRLRLEEASRQEHESAQALASISESGADIVGRNEEAARVRSALAKLPAEQREALELAFFTAMTHKEIAKQVRQPLGTVKARIRRGLLKLRERMK